MAKAKRKSKTAPPSPGGSAKRSSKTDKVGSDFTDFGAYGFGSGGRPYRDAEEAAPLSWRQPDSLSDWTIAVTRVGGARERGDGLGQKKSSSPVATRRYHVHRNILAVGPKRCGYFAALFRGQNQNQLAELADATSHIDLETSAADAFPVMLDYLYCTDQDDGEFGVANITAKNAVALRHLAQYFQTSKLFEIATDRLTSEFVPKNSPTFLLEATVYGDERLANAAIDVCAGKIGNISAERFEQLPPNLFIKILSSRELSADCSEHLSRIVAHYCEAHLDDGKIDEDMFAIMTDETIMPDVDSEAALSMLNILTELSSSSKLKAGTEKLRVRCMEAVSTSWLGVADPKAKKSTGKRGKRKGFRCKKDVSDLPSDLQIELLRSCLRAAKEDYEEKKDSLHEVVGKFGLYEWGLLTSSEEESYDEDEEMSGSD